MLYLWVKAAHIIFVIAWMAGMLIYPRYKIHQMAAAPGEQQFETLKAASARLKSTILTPAMLFVWVFGIVLVSLNPVLLEQGWLHAKILLVLIMTGVHGYFTLLGKKIDAGEQPVSSRTLRMLNEVPFLLMIVIVILVVVVRMM